MPIVILVTDRIYTKTLRFIEKIKLCIDEDTSITLAIVNGFPVGIAANRVSSFVSEIIEGSVQHLSEKINIRREKEKTSTYILALNESSILPAIAIRHLLGISSPSGFIESCDKRITRRLLSKAGSDLALAYCVATPGQAGSASNYFPADRYIVKPALGMSSSDVKIFNTWADAKDYAESSDHATEWVPTNVVEALDHNLGRTDARIIEPYIDGTEFSIDGWIKDEAFVAIVQHKLCVIEQKFIGDGPTISPPINSTIEINEEWSGLKNSEESICNFGRAVLKAINFSQGVFHIEGREDHLSGKLSVIEINSRAPGGSLWKTALLRNGYDLEIVDILIQLGKPARLSNNSIHNYVLHYPFYASNTGTLNNWGDLEAKELLASQDITIDFAAQLEDVFYEKDMSEEPYLAFAVAHSESLYGILAKCQTILNLNSPQIS